MGCITIILPVRHRLSVWPLCATNGVQVSLVRPLRRRTRRTRVLYWWWSYLIPRSKASCTSCTGSPRTHGSRASSSLSVASPGSHLWRRKWLTSSAIVKSAEPSAAWGRRGHRREFASRRVWTNVSMIHVRVGPTDAAPAKSLITLVDHVSGYIAAGAVDFRSAHDTAAAQHAL
ncbi:hypothetical protein K437DRAFT_36028 [Tilletiaria anomala UBC 951]|uniref:Uncharacterized protein n=1 Tax=Tilletiaria anomala (strain ATCC 24038 / CBS 436.72 / UBC 951) TaxID=1037660 RepID=A0A066VBK1_TILAU|nr:uncharacterized protein K437DRAFT_36028 [Tilletiaria anomala UBC 951]KDN37678.1 hypothetical protein K437DRAFT_36028 [Tilletiaria anomala UBC 951]